MGEYKKRYAVIDNYHEDGFPVIAVCETYKAAEDYIGEKIRQDWLIGNCYDYGIVDLEIGIAPEREAVPQGDAMSACTGCV